MRIQHLVLSLAAALATLGLLAFGPGAMAYGQATPASVIATVNVGPYPKGVAVNPDTNQVYVALFYESRVVRIDGATNTVTGGHDTGGSKANQIAVNAAANRLYVTNRDSQDVSFLDATTLDVIGRHAVGALPWGLALNAAGNELYVSNFGSSSVTVLDATSGATRATLALPVGDRPTVAAFSPVMHRLYVPGWDSGNLYVVDAAHQVHQPFTIGAGAFGVAVEAGTEHVWLTNHLDGTDRMADGSVADPNALWAAVSNGRPGKPALLAVNANTHHAFIMEAVNGREVVYVTDTQTYDLLQMIDLGEADEDEGGQGVAVNPVTDRVYVSNYRAGTVTVLQDSGGAAEPPTPTNTPTEVVPPPATPTFTPTEVAPATSTPTLPPPTAPSGDLPYVVNTIPVGTHPKSVTIDGLRRFTGLVALFDESRLVAFSIQDLSVGGGTYTLGLHPNQVLYGTAYRLFVTNRDSNNLAQIPWVGPGEACTGPTGDLPWGVAFGPNQHVYVSNFGNGHGSSISILDLQCSVIKTVPLPNDRPAFVAANGLRVYVAGWLTGNLYILDANDTLTTPINVGPGAFGLALHPLANRLYLTNRLDGRMYIIDTTNDNITGIVNLPGKAYAVAVNYKTDHVFVVDAANDRVYVLDAASGALITTLAVGHQDADDGGQGIAVALENNRVFVSNYADGTMTAIQDVNTAPAAPANVTGAPVQVSFPKGATLETRRATLDWADPTGATRFEFQLRLGNKKGQLVENKTDLSFSQTMTRALKPGQTYVWRARACGATCGKWSGWWKFTVGKNAQ